MRSVTPESPSNPSAEYRFGPFHLQPRERRLLKEGEPIALTARAFDLLLALVERAGHLVSKEELLKRVWPNLVVEESNLQVHVSALRKIIGQDAIATIIGRGYRFAMALEDRAAPDAPATPLLDAITPPPPRSKRRHVAVVAGVAAGIAAFAAWHFTHRGDSTAARSGEVRSLAVLPFHRLNPGDARDDYLSVGLTDALIVHLGNLRRIVVRPTTSVLKYEGATDPGAAGKEQAVDAILTGTIQSTGGSIRVAAQLIDTASGKSLWAGKFDEPPSDLFKLEDSLSQQIAQALLRRLDDGERQRLALRSTQDADAHQLYLRGKYQWSRFSEAGLDKAAEYYSKAIEKDPNFALAYAGLAGTYNVRGAMGFVTPLAVWARTRAYAEKAVALDPGLAEAHVVLAAERLLYGWDFEAAKHELERAVELSPNSGDAYSLLSYVDVLQGRLAESIEHATHAVSLDPNSALFNTDLASAHYAAGHYSEAAAAWNRVTEIDPAFSASLIVGAQALERLGRYQDAIAECERLIKGLGRAPSVLSALAAAQASSGDRAQAKAIAEELAGMWKARYFPPVLVAIAYAAVNEDDAAIAWIQRSIDSRDPQVIWLAAEPQLARLRSRPEWPALVKSVNTPKSPPASP